MTSVTNTFLALPYSAPIADAQGNLSNAWRIAFGNNLVPTLSALAAAANAPLTLAGVITGQGTGSVTTAFASKALTAIAALGNGIGALTNDGAGNFTYLPPSNGTMTNLSVISNNGITSSVANPSSAPVITLGLGAITPTSVTTGSVSGTTITASTSFSGPGTGLTGTAAGLSIGGTAANSSQLLGNTWASPGAIGGTTPNSGNFTTISCGTVSIANGSVLKINSIQVLTSQQSGIGANLSAATLSGTYATDLSKIQALYNQMVALIPALKTHGLIAT